MQAQCQREVVELHGFVVGWMTGAVPRSAATFARLADVLADGFALISPRGVITERRPLLASWKRRMACTAPTRCRFASRSGLSGTATPGERCVW